MQWDEFFERHEDWAASTQFRHIASLTGFTSADEVCEAVENLYEDKLMNKLLNRALGQGMIFSAVQVVRLSESVNDDMLKILLAQCKEPFDALQMEDLEVNSMMQAPEILALCGTKMNVSAISWESYETLFDNLSDADKLRCAKTVSGPVDSDTVALLAEGLFPIGGTYILVEHALQCGIRFTRSDIDSLTYLGNKNLNRLLVFQHLSLFDDFDLFDLEEMLFPQDFREFNRMKGYAAPAPVQRPRQPSLLVRFLCAIGLSSVLNAFLENGNDDSTQ